MQQHLQLAPTQVRADCDTCQLLLMLRADVMPVGSRAGWLSIKPTSEAPAAAHAAWQQLQLQCNHGICCAYSRVTLPPLLALLPLLLQ